MSDKKLKDQLDELHKIQSSLTKEAIKKQIEESMKAGHEKRLEAEKKTKYPEDKRTGVCVFCQGKVIARMSREYFGDPMHMIMGPGSKNQFTTVHHGFHCENCGLKYEFPPNINKDE